MRIFIAVAVPDDIRQRVEESQKRLRTVPADVRWVETDKFHLTLKFLGEVNDDKFPAVVAAATAAVKGTVPFTVTLAGVGAFPSMRAPRVLWAGITAGQQELQSLAERVDEHLNAIGFAREKRRFSGHLTLGRVRSQQNIEALVKKMDALQATPFGAFRVRSVEVMQSILHPQGSHYQCLESISI